MEGFDRAAAFMLARNAASRNCSAFFPVRIFYAITCSVASKIVSSCVISSYSQLLREW